MLITEGDQLVLYQGTLISIMQIFYSTIKFHSALYELYLVLVRSAHYIQIQSYFELLQQELILQCQRRTATYNAHISLGQPTAPYMGFIAFH